MATLNSHNRKETSKPFIIELKSINSFEGKLTQAKFVNIVFMDEKDDLTDNNASAAAFRVSDHENNDVSYVHVKSMGDKTILTFVLQEYEWMQTVYMKGSGVVQLYDPLNKSTAECLSTVSFKCLTTKVKYNLRNTDSSSRILKITSAFNSGVFDNTKMHFKVMNTEERKHSFFPFEQTILAEVKMGSRLNTCAHIRFLTDDDQMTFSHRKYIVASWVTFMHYGLDEENHTDFAIT